MMHKRPLIAAIVNATGDSFSEGSASGCADAAERALRLLDAGADWLDLGGESTRPGAAEVAPAEEMRRILPVLERVLRERPDTVFSIDTRHAETARAALEMGAAVINDVSMLRHDPEIAGVAAQYGAGLVLCHSRGTPEDMQSGKWYDYPGGIAECVLQELQVAVQSAVDAGVAADKIWLDPGFGFAKDFEQNRRLMQEIALLCRNGRVFAGVSRKSFIGRASGVDDPAGRLGGTLAAELFLARQGAAVLRTHDPAALRQALAVAEWLGEW